MACLVSEIVGVFVEDFIASVLEAHEVSRHMDDYIVVVSDSAVGSFWEQREDVVREGGVANSRRSKGLEGELIKVVGCLNSSCSQGSHSSTERMPCYGHSSTGVFGLKGVDCLEHLVLKVHVGIIKASMDLGTFNTRVNLLFNLNVRDPVGDINGTSEGNSDFVLLSIVADISKGTIPPFR